MNETPEPSSVPPGMVKHIRPWDKWPDFPKIKWIEPAKSCTR